MPPDPSLAECAIALAASSGLLQTEDYALREHYADLARMEDILRASDLDWTAVRSPRLTDKPATGRYRTAYGQNLRRGVFISRADVARCMLSALENAETFRQTVGIAN